MLNKGKIITHNCAVSDYEGNCSFKGQIGSLSHLANLSTNSELIQVNTIDNLFLNEKIGAIKMDIEGAELKALIGAKSVIQKHSPFLAICIYHKPNDLYEIPLLINEVTTNSIHKYKFYLRHHSLGLTESVFYAVPE